VLLPSSSAFWRAVTSPPGLLLLLLGLVLSEGRLDGDRSDECRFHRENQELRKWLPLLFQMPAEHYTGRRLSFPWSQTSLGRPFGCAVSSRRTWGGLGVGRYLLAARIRLEQQLFRFFGPMNGPDPSRARSE